MINQRKLQQCLPEQVFSRHSFSGTQGVIGKYESQAIILNRYWIFEMI
jgi:hypothetical protein